MKTITLLPRKLPTPILILTVTFTCVSWPLAGRAQHAAAGNFQTLVTRTDGQTVGWGYNTSGQLADGTTTSRSAPVFLAGTNRFLKIASGGDYYNPGHGLGIERDGSVLAWGSNAYGQMGQPPASGYSTTPVNVSGLSNILDIAAGTVHSLALKSDGTVWAFGYGGFGALGNGSTSDSATPVQVSGLSNVIAIAAGDYHSLALRADGSVFCWGYGNHGQLGISNTANQTTPVLVTNVNAVSIAGAVASSFAARADGTLLSWGYNYYATLGDGGRTDSALPVMALLTNVAKVAGSYHAVALRTDGTLWAWGHNSQGEAGRGTTGPWETVPLPVIGMGSAMDLSVGVYHTVAVKADGSLWTWGWNQSYQLATNDASYYTGYARQLTNIAVPPPSFQKPHLLFVKADGSVQAAGHNTAGQLGDSTFTDHFSPVTISNFGSVRSAAAGKGHSVALRWDGSVWTWGWNACGQLGLGSGPNTNAPVKVSGLADVSGVAAGSMHTLAVRSNGVVLAWGLNDLGQLGDGTITNRDTPTTIGSLSEIKAVAAGERHSLAITTNGSVYTWGRNSCGQLGDGTQTNRTSPVSVSGISSASAIAAGEGHSVVLTTNGTVLAFGDNRCGQLGDGTTIIRLTAATVTNLTNVTAITSGDSHTLALKSDGTVWAWGRNTSGQLGDGTTTLRSSPVQVAGITNAILILAQGDSSVAVLASGEALVWGANQVGQLGTGGTLSFNTPFNAGFQYFEPFSPYIKNAMANSPARFKAGTGTDPHYWGFVIPLSYQSGVLLSPGNDNSSTYSNSLPWFIYLRQTNNYPNTYLFDYEKTTNAVYGGTNQYFLQDNVIAAFGTRAGASPLYVDRPYLFGIHAGYQKDVGDANDSKLPVRIRVFRLPNPTDNPSNVVAVATNYFTVPLRRSQPQEWQSFATNDFSTKMDVCGLRSTLQLVEASEASSFGAYWIRANDVSPDRYANAQFVIQHRASAEALQYGFVIDGIGRAYVPTTNRTELTRFYTSASTYEMGWLPLYALNFDGQPHRRAQFLDQPQFEGEPIPSRYLGKTLQELQTNLPPITTTGTLTNSSYLALDASPEFLRHPLLDKLVADLHHDPLALTAFVQNTIELSDPFAMGVGNNSTTPALDYPGLGRNAVEVLRQRQGSALEQCALLVYLLRQAGYAAAYAFPTNRNIKIPDTHLSKMLRMQLHGAVDYRGIQYTTESLIAVNYPWVIVDLGDGQLRHVFPWLKDTEVIEGLNLYDYMPPEYDSAYKFVRDYVLGKTNILALSSESDTLGDLFPKFLDKHLRENHPGISVDDIGIRFRNRQRQYARWQDLPRPLVVDNPQEAVIVADVTSGVTAVPKLSQIFNIVRVQVKRADNGDQLFDTGFFNQCDLGSRQFLLFPDDNKLRLWLQPFQPSITNVLSNSNAFSAAATGITNGQVKETALDASIPLTLKVVMTRHAERFLESGYSIYLPITVWTSYTNSLTYATNEIAAIHLYNGRATKEMLMEQAKAFWEQQYRMQADTNYTPKVEDYYGTLVHLMMLKYNEKCARVDEWLQDLHKSRWLPEGYTSLAAFRRSASGAMTPRVDIPGQVNYIINASMRPDVGDAYVRQRESYGFMSITAVSGEEHAVINNYLRVRDAVSTVKLLQLAQQRSTGPSTDVIELYHDNYQGYYNSHYNDDPGVWSAINTYFAGVEGDTVRVLVTPGPILNDAGTYSGVGALILGPGTLGALISGNFNGGFGAPVPDFYQEPVELDPDSLTLSLGSRDWEPREGGISDREAADLPSDILFSPEQQQEAQQAAREGATGASNLQAIQAQRNAGVAPKTGILGWLQTVADPVDSINGYFHVDTKDLSLPGPMPILARRNYSSHNLQLDMFGYSWKLNYFPYLVSITNETGIISLRATEDDGAVIEFEPGETNVWTATAAANPGSAHNNNEGGKNRNLVFGTRIERVSTNGLTSYYQKYPDGALKTYQVLSDFAITNGIHTLARIRPYLTRWDDNRGNSLTFSYGTNVLKADYGELYRIQSSAGMYLGFNYDDVGRVVEAYAGDGRRLYYEYDKYGDLVSVTLPDASQIGYEYQHYSYTYTNQSQVYTNVDSTHLLVREIKPDGRLLENVYDDQRRVTNQLATVGQDLRLIRNATFVYSNNFAFTNAFTNLIHGYTLVIDVFGNTNHFEYTNGLLTRIADPLGYAIDQEWYWTNGAGGYARALKSKTDKRGFKTTFLYDANGNAVTNIISGVDLTGNGQTNAVITYAYTNNNLLITQTDALGNTVRYRYDDPNYPLLRTSVARYASNGVAIATNLLAYTNAVTVFTNGQTVYTNKVFGVLRQEKAAAGTADERVTDYAYDGRGFVTQIIRYTGTPDPAVTNHYSYNDRGELAEQTDAAGRTVRLAYDPRGNPQWTEKFDQNGNRVFWEYSYYNENGELTWSDGPRYNPEDYVWRDYDGAGRNTVQIRWRSRAKADGTGVEAEEGDWLFASTFNEYDAFGNLLRVIDQYGNYDRMTYDANGQMISKSRYSISNSLPLATEWFGYEPGGLLSAHTNALGGVTRKFYTTTGKLYRQENPDGSTNGWVYWLDERLATNFLANGSYWETQHDDANRKVTRTLRTANGTFLSQEIDEFDRHGNLIRKTDAQSNVFLTTFDGLNRVKITTGPAGTANAAQQITTNYYDAAGVAVTNANALGERTVTTFDALSRAIQADILNAAGVVVRRTTMSYAPDFHSQTVSVGTGTNAVSTTTFTDTFGKPVLAVFADDTFTLNRYDMVGNLVSSRDELGQQTQFSYDPFYRLSRKILPDGAVITLGYDVAGNLTSRAMPGGQTWSATYDSALRKRSEQLANGASTTRNFSYAYYAANSTAPGLLQTISDPRGVTSTLIYDAFLRVKTNSAAGPLSDQNQVTIYSYDNSGRTTNVLQTTSGRPSTQVNRYYSAYGQVIEETVLTNSSPVRDEVQIWDAAGRRTQLYAPNFGTGSSIAFSSRADGLLQQVTQAGQAFTFDFADNGLLKSRSNPWRSVTVNQRDSRGRLTQATTTVGGATPLVDILSWRDNSTLSGYTANRQGSGVWNESRAYSYNARGQLTNETFAPQANTNATYAYTFDSNKLGIRTGATVSGALSASWQAGTLDNLAHLTLENWNVSQWHTQARGFAIGADSVSAWLDDAPLPVLYDNASTNGLWQAEMSFGSGSHNVRATAYHPLSRWSTNATNVFIAVGLTNVASAYDAVGNVTNRTFSNGRVQTLYWDAFGRLMQVSQRDAQTNGFDWTAVYDALGRRLQTVNTPVSNNVALASTTIDSWYDPQVEFLEIGVAVNGARTWKVNGPDLNGGYGALQGVGGLEATVRESDGNVTPVLNDSFGNVVATIYGGQVVWAYPKLVGYGPVAGYSMPVLSTNVTLADATLWRSRRMDPTGFFWLGARYYVEGRFLSADPLGHDGSMDLYAFANGDPVNYYDPDGRLAKAGAKAIGSVLSIPGMAVTMLGQAMEQSGLPLIKQTGITLQSAGSAVASVGSIASGILSLNGQSLGSGLQQLGMGVAGVAGIGALFEPWVSPDPKAKSHDPNVRVTGGIPLPKPFAKNINAAWNIWSGFSKSDQEQDFSRGMKKWHALSNALWANENGITSTPWNFLGGLIHEVEPFGVSAEIGGQGFFSWFVDTPGDITANTFGTIGGLLVPGVAIPELGRVIGQIIPGPPDSWRP